MNTLKIVFGAVVVLLLGVIGMRVDVLKLGGIDSSNTNWYSTATHTQIQCNGSTSTVVLAAASGQGQRNSFELSNASATQVLLCKSASSCASTNGIVVTSSTGSYEQNDNYYGAYSCHGGGATSTVRIIYSQS